MHESSPAALEVDTGHSARLFQFAAFAALLLLFFYSGFCLQVLPVVAPSILQDWSIPARALAAPLALSSIGMGLGAVIGGIMGDAKGRKFPIIGFAALQGAAVFFSAFATGPSGLYVLMFANGLGLGGYFSSGMALMTELAPARRRGLMISLAILFGPLGLSLCSLVAGYVAPRFGWSSLFLLGGAACIPLLFALVVFLPESPKYLARFPRRAEERRRILARLDLSGEDEPAPEAPKRRGFALIALLRERLVATLTLWLLFFVMYVLGSAVLGWVPVVLSSQNFAIGFASSALFYWTLGSLVGTPLSGWSIGRFGVHNTGVAFAAGAALAIALLTFLKLDPAVTWLVIALLPIAGFAVSGVVTSLYTLAAESYPTAMRATGIGMADAIGRVGGVLGAFAGVLALDRAGAFGFFFSILCLAILAFVILLLLRLHHRRAEADAS